MSRSGSFKSTKKHLTEQASKALYGVFRKRYFDLDVRFDLISFDDGQLKWTRNIIWGDVY